MAGVVIVVAVLAAFTAGLAVAVAVARRQRRDATGRDAEVNATIERVIALANERLGAHTAQAAGELDARKGLIDQQLQAMSAELGKVANLVATLERDRERKFGALSEQIAEAGEQTARLAETTHQLRQALSSTKARGQWGERMAEDVLRLAGFVENVNYRKQTALAGGRGIPDFTFVLPRDLLLHMDVKFPLDNYLRYLEAHSDSDRERHRVQFLRDVRQRVKDLAARDYVEPDTTVDCVLLFIPNEQLYAFLQEQDGELLDAALRHKVVLCSPLTLFAVLAVIRQAVDNFVLERTSDEILSLLGGFRQQWQKFGDQMDTLGKRLSSAQGAYDDLVGTRRRALERPLERLEALRCERNVDTVGPVDALARIGPPAGADQPSSLAG
ncbi:MAG TPA: DNA recombination protein RmuC [Egibacteraceae bacterium]|nr:DNA recombination protein RmuC [Egibacteraceae bacterium]